MLLTELVKNDGSCCYYTFTERSSSNAGVYMSSEYVVAESANVAFADLPNRGSRQIQRPRPMVCIRRVSLSAHTLVHKYTS